MCSGYPLPNPPFFSYSSVPSFLAQAEPRGGLGKHSLRECHDPDRPEVSPQKRPRILTSERGDNNIAQDQPWHHDEIFVRQFNEAELRSIVEPADGEVNIEGLGLDCPEQPLFWALLRMTNNTADMRIVLQLAYRFLSSRHTLIFFHNLMTAEISPLRSESRRFNVFLWQLPLPHEMTVKKGLTVGRADLTRKTLVALVDHVHFHSTLHKKLDKTWAYAERVTSPMYPDHAAYSDLTPARPTPAQSSNEYLRVLNFTGTNATVNIHPCFFEMFTNMHNPTDAQRLPAMYFLAITLVHEIAHVVYMCRFPAFNPPPGVHVSPDFPQTEYEAFFASQRRSELGRAMETFIFGGGRILSLAQDPQFRIGLGWQRWPDVDEFYVKDRNGTTVPLRRDGTGPPKWETQYAINHEWIRRQFGWRFWEEFEKAGLQGGLLRVEKRLGSRRRNTDFFKTGEDGLESGASSKEVGVEGGSGNGVVRPEQPLVESEDEEDDSSSL